MDISLRPRPRTKHLPKMTSPINGQIRWLRLRTTSLLLCVVDGWSLGNDILSSREKAPGLTARWPCTPKSDHFAFNSSRFKWLVQMAPLTESVKPALANKANIADMSPVLVFAHEASTVYNLPKKHTYRLCPKQVCTAFVSLMGLRNLALYEILKFGETVAQPCQVPEFRVLLQAKLAVRETKAGYWIEFTGRNTLLKVSHDGMSCETIKLM